LNYSLFPQKPIVNIAACRLNIKTSDYLGSQLYVYNIYERTTFHHLLPLIQPDDIVMGIGANIGLYSILIAAQLKTGSIHSFEPVLLKYQGCKAI